VRAKDQDNETVKTTIAVIPALAVLGTLIALGSVTALAGTTGPASHTAGAPGITGLVTYAARTQVLSANGTSSWIVACPAGFLPVGGGAIIQVPRLENVTQAGFHVSAATGKFHGYQASVSLGTLPRGGKVRFAVRVACVAVQTPPVYGPRAPLSPAPPQHHMERSLPGRHHPGGWRRPRAEPAARRQTPSGFRSVLTGTDKMPGIYGRRRGSSISAKACRARGAPVNPEACCDRRR
jgi:hypothetical protein